MALTLAEQKELQQLLAQREQLAGGARSGAGKGLTPEEEMELANLRRARESGMPPGVGPSPGVIGAFGETPGPTAQEFKEQALKITDLPLGAMAGGTVGGIAGIPGGPAGMIGGAMLGGGGGEATEQLIRRAIGAEAPQTSEEAARQIAMEGVVSGIGEAGGQAVVRAGQAVGRAIAPTLRSGAKEIVGAIQGAFPEKPTILTSKWNPIRRLFRDPQRVPALLPAQTTESLLLDNIQEITKKSLVGSGRIIKAQETTNRVVSDLVDDFVTKLTDKTSVEGVGELVIKSLRGGSEAFTATGRGLYGQVDDIVGAATVGTQNIKKTAENMLLSVGLKRANAQQVKLLKDIIELPDSITFAEAHSIRSDLLNVSRTGTELVGGKAKGTAKLLASRMDNAMTNSAQAISPEAEQLWRAANEFYKNGATTYNSKLVRGIVNAKPSAVLDKFLKRGAATDIKLLKETINDPVVWQKVQGHFADKVMQGGITDEISGALNGASMLRALRRTYGPDVVKAIAPKGELEPLRKFATALALNQAKQPGGFKGTVLISALQLSAGSKLAWDVLGPGDTDVTTAGAFAIVFGPGAFARALTSPRVNKLILEGFKTGPKISAVSSFVSRLGAALAEEGIDARITKGKEAMMPLQEAPQQPSQPTQVPFNMSNGSPNNG